LQNGDPSTAGDAGARRREAGLTGMDGHFNAFTFVNRITALQPGISARGNYFIPPHIETFPQSLVAEAIGQLAAWAAMSAVDFKRRPLAGIAGMIELLAPIRAGQTLELSVELESVDDEAAAYRGSASADGIPVVQLQNCVGPMLPVEEFDDPNALRKHFAVLRGNGSTPGGFGGIPALEFSRSGGEPEKSTRADLQIPASAEFFADHFPRRPVFPGALLMNLNVQLAAMFAAEIPIVGQASSLSDGQDARPTWNLRAISDLKLRAFIPPGEQLELEAKVFSRTENSLAMIVETRKEKKLAGSARVLFSAEENP
jgi:3-hydroxymyristoyl/3-hydroxydecanoyl-(acyl carrier protein) dehydratase